MKRAKWSLSDVQSRLLNTPLMVSEARARIALGVMGPRLNIGALITAEQAGEQIREPIANLTADVERARAEMESMPGDDDMKRYVFVDGVGVVEKNPYEIWNGVAILTVRGSLFAENGLDPSSGATGYDGLSYKIRHAIADSRVKGAILDTDSGGGEVIDLLETCNQLRAFAEVKPLRSIIRGTAASAAYALAACAGKGNITAADYSIVGSIGAIMIHGDVSKMLEQDGIDVTIIKSAAHKDDASSYKPLDEDVAASLQEMVDSCADSFIDHVADARGMDRAGIVDQQARFYSGQQALDLGLVDKFMAYDDSMKEFAATVNGMARRPAAAPPTRKGVGATSSKENKMDTIDSALAAINQPDSTEADQRAALTAFQTAATAAGHTAGVTAERERVTALADLDAGSTLSDALTAAVGDGTSPGDYAIALTKSAKAAGPAALAAAAADAAKPSQLPTPDAAANGVKPKANRGQALADKRKVQAGA